MSIQNRMSLIFKGKKANFWFLRGCNFKCDERHFRKNYLHITFSFFFFFWNLKFAVCVYLLKSLKGSQSPCSSNSPVIVYVHHSLSLLQWDGFCPNLLDLFWTWTCCIVYWAPEQPIEISMVKVYRHIILISPFDHLKPHFQWVQEIMAVF